MTTNGLFGRPISDWTVLLVEDRAEVLEVHRELVASIGPRTVIAESGEEALTLLQADDVRIDLALTDVDLPGISGVELLELARQHRPMFPAVLTSGRVREDLAGQESAPTVFLAKPFSAEDLARAFDRLASWRPSADRNPTGVETAPDVVLDVVPGREESRSGRRRAWPLTGVGAVLAASLFLAIWLRPSDRLPDRVESSVRRGGEVELVAPAGLVDEVPVRFEWSPLAGAGSYVVTVQSVDDTILWAESTGQTTVDVPDLLAERLHRGVAYFWRVEALDEGGQSIGRSTRVRFQPRLASDEEGSSP